MMIQDRSPRHQTRVDLVSNRSGSKLEVRSRKLPTFSRPTLAVVVQTQLVNAPQGYCMLSLAKEVSEPEKSKAYYLPSQQSLVPNG
jgi:hypothetical protein